MVRVSIEADEACDNPVLIVVPAGALTSLTYYVSVWSWGFGSHNQKFALFASNVF